MSALNEPPIEAAAGTAPFRDEIFKWPIASVKNVDVWDLIFKKYVTHPTDQQNLVLASPQFFGPLLKERKCSNLFGEVLDILHRKHYLTLSKKKFLCFRGLSKTCKISIDRVIRINNHCLLHDSGIQHDRTDRKHVCWNSKDWYPFLSLPVLEHKIKKYPDMNLNEGLIQLVGTLPGLEFGYFDVDRYPNLEALLSPVERQIYHLRFRLNWSSDTWHAYFRVLHTLLGIMPNLVSLRIEELSYYSDKKWLMDLRPCVEANSLPTLNRLIYLKVDRIPAEVANALFAKYAAKLEKLSLVSESLINAFLHSSELFYQANKLTDVWIALVSNDLSPSLRLNMKWPASLRNVCVRWNYYGCPTERLRDFQRFCNALLEQFANHRLNSLSIDIDKGSNFWSLAEPLLNADFRIRLPFLRRLWIRSSLLHINNLDFILGVSDSLEELVLNLSGIERKQKSSLELIWFIGYWHRMHESNIWEKMPNLRKLTIRNIEITPMQCYEYFRPAYDSRTFSLTAGSGAHFSCD